jgi:phenylacetate-CoA ligase
VRTLDRLTRDELSALQDRKLARLLGRARTNPFYRERLASYRDGDDPRAFLRSFEPIDKDELLDDQNEHPPFGLRLGVPESETASVHTTGGTSGRGQELHALTWRDVEAAGHIGSFAFRWAGLRFGEPAAYNVGFSNSSGGNAMLRGIQTIGNTPLLIGQAGFEEKLRLLAEARAVGLYGTPSALNGLLRTAQDVGFDPNERLPQLRFLLTSAEPYPLEWAERIEQGWGAKLFEDYGATQSASAICAATCERGAVVDGGRGSIHFFEWSFLFEVVDPSTREPTPPGEWGELLITTLDKDASPLLRFSTRDRIHYLGTDRCECGRELLSIEAGTITRYDDMLKIKGQNVWPADIESALFGHPAVREFTAEVAIGPKGRDELYLRIALVDGQMSAPAVETELKSAFKTRFNLTPQVQLVGVETLPQWQSPEAKSRRIKDVRQEGLRA